MEQVTVRDFRPYLVDEHGNEELASKMWYFECPDCDYKSNHTFLNEEAQQERNEHESELQPDGEWHDRGTINFDEVHFRSSS